MAKTLNLKSEIKIQNSNKINVTIANGKLHGRRPADLSMKRQPTLRMLLMAPDSLVDRGGNPIRNIQILQARKDPRGGQGCYFVPMGNSHKFKTKPIFRFTAVAIITSKKNACSQ